MTDSPLTPTRLEKLQALFENALDLPAEERSTYLDSQTDEAALRDEVLALISAHERGGDFKSPVSASALVDAATGEDRWVGTRVGAYRVISRIGVGGMGVVYEATRDDDQYRKRVAVKFLHRHVGSEPALARFRAERQILASLNHANIAALLDGGVTEDGQPYFIMEYVDGKPITQWCDANHQTVRQRLELFLQVCEAVESAHRSLVVHRDLKPGNILVTDEGRVKLLDFGIARLMSPESESGDLPPTLSGSRSFTPDYAAPEQMRGLRVDTRADVYALGVILFELLAGRRPFDLRDKSLRESERIVCEIEAPRVSSAVDEGRAASMSERSTARVRSQLEGDLDAIAGVALRKEPERRYGSAQSLAQDIRRYLNGRTVSARPDGVAYRMGKLVRRRKLETAAIAVAVLSLIGGMLATSAQAKRAEAQSRRAEQVTGFLTTMLGSADPESLGRDVTVREVLDSAALRADTLASNPLLEAEIRSVIGTTYMGLGEFEAGEAQFRRALDAHKRRVPEGDYSTAVTLTKQSHAFEYLGDLEAADSVLALAGKLFEKHPHEDPLQYGDFLDQRGRILARLGNNEAAEVVAQQSLDVMERAAPGRDSVLAYSYVNLGLIKSELGKHAEAEALYDKGVAATKRAFGNEHVVVASMLSPYATVLERAGKVEKAGETYREALAIRRKLLGEDHPEYAWTMFNYADHLLGQKRYSEAAEWARKVVALRGKTLPDTHMALATAMGVLGRALGPMDSLAAGERYLRESLELRKKSLPEGHWAIASSESMLGAHLTLAKRFQEAEALLLPAEKKILEARGENATVVNDVRGRIVQLYTAWGKADEAAKWQRLVRPPATAK